MNVTKFFTKFFTPIRTYGWVIRNNCSWLGTSEDGKWSYYWFGNFHTGYQVKVRIH